MSLAPDRGSSGRARSRSRSRQEDKSRESSYVYAEEDISERYGSGRSKGSGLPYPSEGGLDSYLPGGRSGRSYEEKRSNYRASSPTLESTYRSSRDRVERDTLPGSFPGEDRRRDRYEDYESEKLEIDYKDSKRRSHKYSDDEDTRRDRHNSYSTRHKKDDSDIDDDKLKFLPQKYSRKYEEEESVRYSERDRDRRSDRRRKGSESEEDLAYGRSPSPLPPRGDDRATYGSYMSGSKLEEKRTTRHKYERDDKDDRHDRDDRRRDRRDDRIDSRADAILAEVDAKQRHRDSRHKEESRRDDPRSSGLSMLTADPSGRERERSRERRRDKSPGPVTLLAEPGKRARETSRDRRGSGRDRSPQPPTSRMSTLTVETGRPSHSSLSMAPGSPLLESYRGTYQESSPMPSPLMIGYHDRSEDERALEVLAPLSPAGSDVDSKKKGRRARFHDPEDIASQLAKALKGDKAPDTEPLIEILPSLTHDQVMELRFEYKRLVKTGSDRKGVNVAKHIRARLKDEHPTLMKACYSTALGMWESESYWSSFWYQGDKTRRELLIEALMGRTNEEIRFIKESFHDKKYDNSLSKCMKMELKEDKFKKAVLMVLEERRMEEVDSDGRPLAIDYELVDKDVESLHKSVKSEKGSESTMISIVVLRSDSHLRCVLKEYERQYHSNFARDSLKKSGNLVGEVLAHILNGVINRPVRDALLLHHAVSASRKDELRHELLISRLVRCHWDAAHMLAVKRAFRERYDRDLQDAVRDASHGQWGRFCEELCIGRMPNDVRRVERVEKVEYIRR